MGVLTDYFRAPDAASVIRALDQEDGDSPLTAHPSLFDGFESKHIDPCVVLGMLVAAAGDLPWRVDLVGDRRVWPRPRPDANPYEPEGPIVFELGAAARDLLAGVPDAGIPAVVDRWVRAEELYGASAEEMRPVAEDFIGLARRARDAGELLYCWICL